MEAVVGSVDGAADRLAGVVDEDVDVTVGLEHLVRHSVNVVEVGEIAAMDEALPSEQLDLSLDLVELLLGAGDEQDAAAGLPDLERCRFADSGRGTGDQNVSILDRIAQRARENATCTRYPLTEGPERLGALDRYIPNIWWRHAGTVPSPELGGEGDASVRALCE